MAARTDFSSRHRGAPWMRLFLALLLALGALASLAPSPAAAATLLVTNTNNSGAGSLRQTMLNAAVGDTIAFDLPGSGPWTITLTSGLPTIINTLNIQGPGKNQLTVQGDNTFRLFSINAPGKAVGISGLTLSKGKAVGSYGGNLRSSGGDLTLTDVALINGTADSDQGGAGAFLSNGTSKLEGVVISGNAAWGTNIFGSGAGLHVAENHGPVSVTIEDSLITYNTSLQHNGGGLALSRTSGVPGRTLSVALTDSVVSGNKANPGDGAGIYNDEGMLTLTNSLVSGNTGYSKGGGIHNNGGTVTLNGSTVILNTLSAGHGAGLYNLKGTLALTDSTVSGNIATFSGGGIMNEEGTLTVVGSTISENEAMHGGGIFSGSFFEDPATATLVNVTLSGNKASVSGGGFKNNIGTADLVFVTIVGNSAALQGGGLSASTISGKPATTKVRSSIILGNSSAGDDDCASSNANLAPVTSTGHNVVGNDTGCPTGGTGDTTALVPAAVLKLGLADNGGPTKTHALVFGSPAIDRVPCVNTIDQRGAARPFGGACDSGSYEAHAFGQVELTLTTNGGSVGRSPAGSGGGPYTYNPGTVVTLTPQPGGGKVFIGWKVDGEYKGWAAPLTITMNASYQVQAIYVQQASFPDVGAGRADATAIKALATRGTIRGYQSGNFGPDDGVTRAQMAALIARATAQSTDDPGRLLTPPACLVAGSWDCEEWDNNFTDREGVDGNLWRNVGTLYTHGVANGYGPAACAAKGKASPCFGPNDPVSYAQTISFITRAMIAKGYWTAQPGAAQPYAGVPAAHLADVTTFHYYTGGIPAPPADWNGEATRGWFARALWAALDDYWGTDNLLTDGRAAGGYVP
jgi:hypothetical protein